MAYTYKINWTETDLYGTGAEDEDDVYTVEEFKQYCEDGAFIDYDGFGHPAIMDLADPDIYIKPSRLGEIPADATHIVWYNK